MPSARLLRRYSVLGASPLWVEIGTARQDELDRHLFEVDDFAELPEADKDLIRRGEQQVAAGMSEEWVRPEDWGDWAAIEAAVDSGDVDALDRALETVGPVWDRDPALAEDEDDLEGVEVDEDGEPVTDAAESKSDWIGL